MPEANRTLELAKCFRNAAADECAMPHYAEMMLRAAADLEASVSVRAHAAVQARLALPAAA